MVSWLGPPGAGDAGGCAWGCGSGACEHPASTTASAPTATAARTDRLRAHLRVTCPTPPTPAIVATSHRAVHRDRPPLAAVLTPTFALDLAGELCGSCAPDVNPRPPPWPASRTRPAGPRPHGRTPLVPPHTP